MPLNEEESTKIGKDLKIIRDLAITQAVSEVLKDLNNNQNIAGDELRNNLIKHITVEMYNDKKLYDGNANKYFDEDVRRYYFLGWNRNRNRQRRLNALEKALTKVKNELENINLFNDERNTIKLKQVIKSMAKTKHNVKKQNIEESKKENNESISKDSNNNITIIIKKKKAKEVAGQLANEVIDSIIDGFEKQKIKLDNMLTPKKI